MGYLKQEWIDILDGGNSGSLGFHNILFVDIELRIFTSQLMIYMYRTRAIIGRSRFEATLVYKPRILGLKNVEFPFLVHKLSVL